MIELRHLRYFTAVAEELSFHRAAERVHIDQSPLSRAVCDLEDQLGVSLFVRAPRRLYLTPAGACLLKEVRKVFVRIEHVKRAVRETSSRYDPPLRIGVSDGIAQPRLAQCFARWQKLAPEIELELTEMRATELAAALKREEVDAGFSFGLPEDAAIAQEAAWRYPVAAMLPAGHQLASFPILPIAELLAFPLVSCRADRQPGLLRQMKAIVQRHISRPILAGEAHTLTGYVTRIASGMGVGLADRGHIETLGRTDVAVVPLTEDEHVITYVLHKHRRFGLPDALQRFIAHAKNLG